MQLTCHPRGIGTTNKPGHHFFLLALAVGIVCVFLALCLLGYISRGARALGDWAPVSETANINLGKYSSGIAVASIESQPVSETAVNQKALSEGVIDTGHSANFGIAAGGGLVYLGQQDLETYFQRLNSLGVGWVRWDVAWNVVQPNDADHYDWSGADRVVSMAKKYGIASLVTIDYAPHWAANTGSCNDNGKCTPKYPEQFGRFAGLVAARYKKDAVSYFEIWNEPNYAYFWEPAPSSTAYVAVLKSAYENIKEVNPDAVVIAGALAPSNDPGYERGSSIHFVKALYSENAQQYFDAISIHPYTYPSSLKNVKGSNVWSQVEAIRKIMVSKGDSDKKIWFTEYGAPTCGPGDAVEVDAKSSFTQGADYVTESAQRELAEDIMAKYQNSTSFLGPFFWFNLIDEGVGSTTIEDCFGLLRRNGTPKPAYDVLRAAIVKDLSQ